MEFSIGIIAIVLFFVLKILYNIFFYVEDDTNGPNDAVDRYRKQKEYKPAEINDLLVNSIDSWDGVGRPHVIIPCDRNVHFVMAANIDTNNQFNFYVVGSENGLDRIEFEPGIVTCARKQIQRFKE